MFLSDRPKRDRFGWPVVDVKCSFCGVVVRSDKVFGVKVEDGVIKKYCNSDSCIEGYFADDIERNSFENRVF